MYKLNFMLLNLLHLCIIHSRTLINYCHVYWFPYTMRSDDVDSVCLSRNVQSIVKWLHFLSQCLLAKELLMRQKNKRIVFVKYWISQQWIVAYLLKSKRAFNLRSGRMLENIFLLDSLQSLQQNLPRCSTK